MALLFKPTITFPHKPSSFTPKSHSRGSIAMNEPTNFSSFVDSSNIVTKEKRKLPILLFDVMDTIVRDPFYQDIPSFFGSSGYVLGITVGVTYILEPEQSELGSCLIHGVLNQQRSILGGWGHGMSMKELIECKHPTAWNEFEKGLIDEDELATKFFKDGRRLDLEGLKNCMKNGYSYLDGIEELLLALKLNNYEIHAFTNYPVWYQMIEDKLKLSNYLSWTFCSCAIGKQKPDPGFYSEVLRYLEVEPGSCVFIDDRKKNVEGAVNAGMVGLQFKGADVLRQDLSLLGINVSADALS